ncbi:MAG: hypothetical protein RR654_09790, partial [Oscillospiraceae bacterium]
EGIVDIVKTKILNFVLEIEVINPEAGEAKLNSNPIPQEKVSQIFNINIFIIYKVLTVRFDFKTSHL